MAKTKNLAEAIEEMKELKELFGLVSMIVRN